MWSPRNALTVLFAVLAFPVPVAASVIGLDPTFGAGDGKAIALLAGNGNGVAHMVRQPDGRLVFVGSCSGQSDFDFCVGRFTVDGVLDTSFNGTGRVVTQIGSSNDLASVVAMQTDGMIVVAGRCSVGAAQQICVARYTATGTLDPVFNSTGKVITSIGSGQSTEATGVAVQADGRLLVSGFCTTSNVRAFCVIRYNADGSLDQNFNPSAAPADRGKVLLLPYTDNNAYGLVLQTDQRIVLVGSCLDGYWKFCATRLTTDGALDLTFNGTGATTTGFVSGDQSTPAAVAIQPDGKLVLAGSCYGLGYVDFCVLRYNIDGTIDTTFATNGITVVPVGAGSDQATSVALRPDGRIVVGGACAGNVNLDFCAIQLTTTGALDRNFNRTGKLLISVGSRFDEVRGIAIQPDGKLVLGGRCDDVTTQFCAVRLSEPCSLDLDGDGSVLATTDALIHSRIALGLTGSAVTNGVNFAPNATRTTWQAIREHLNANCGMSLAN